MGLPRPWRRPALAATLLLSSLAAAAQVFPAYLNYQGKLGDPSGNPLSGTYSFRFKLYNTSAGGSPLFTDANFTGGNALSVANGVYSVQIGSLTTGGIPTSVFFNPEVWLEIDVNAGTNLTGAETLSPRERLTTSPFAFVASNAQYLGTTSTASFTSAGNLQAPYGVIAGSFTATSSAAASAFFGDGSHLTGVPSTGSIAGVYVQKAGDAMTGPLTMLSGSTITVSGNAFSVGGSTFVVAGGNVGIGTASPGANLAIQNGTSSPIVRILGRAADGDAQIHFRNNGDTLSNAYLDAINNEFRSYVPTGSTLTFYAGGIEQMRLDSGGLLGLGTSKPASKLHLSSGTLTVDGTSSGISLYGANAGDTLIAAQNFSATGDGALSLSNNLGNSLFLSNRGSATAGSRYGLPMAGLQFIEAQSGSAFVIGTNGNAAPLALGTQGQERARIDGAGNVGIGTTGPTAALDVRSSTGPSQYVVNVTSQSGASLLNVTGGGSLNVPTSSVAASAFFGDGSHLTGILSTAGASGLYIQKAGDTMNGTLGIGSGNVLRLYDPANSGFASFYLDAADIAQFNYPLNLGIGSSLKVNGANGYIANASSMNASAFFGDGSHLTGVPSTGSIAGVYVQKAGDGMTGPLTMLSGSTITVSGNAFSVGVSTLAVSGGYVGIGTAAPQYPLDIAGTAGNLRCNPSQGVSGEIPAGVLLFSNSGPLTIAAGSAGASNKMEIAYFNGTQFYSALEVPQVASGFGNLSLMKSGGNVGVGTASPSYTLDVNGNLRTQNTILIQGLNGVGSMQVNQTTGYDSYVLISSNPAESTNFYISVSPSGGTASVVSSISGRALNLTASNGNVNLIPNGGKSGIATANPATTLDVNGNAQFGSAATKSTFTTTGALSLAPGAPLTLSGANGSVASASSVTASAFFGDGSHLTGLSGSLSGGVANVVPVWTGATSLGTGSGYITNYSTGIAVQANQFSVGVSTLVVNGGYVGIGTTNPQQPLHILGTNKRVMRLDTGGGNAQTFVEFINNAKTWQVGNHDAFSNYADWGVRNATDNLNPLNLTAAGSVGIGVPAPSATLHVSSAASSGTTLLMEVSSGTAAGQQLMVVQANGNVGIGTTSPTRRLTVSGGGNIIIDNAAAYMVHNTLGAEVSALYSGPDDYNWMYSIRSGYGMKFGGYAGTALMTIQDSGNVGIGTSSPAAKLHVSSGTQLIDGTNPALTVSGGSVTASAFFGDGSHLAGVPSTGSIAGVYVQKAGDAMTGPLTMLSGSTITVSGNAFSVGVSTLVVSGGNIAIGTAAPSSLLDVEMPSGSNGVNMFMLVSKGNSNTDLGQMLFRHTNVSSGLENTAAIRWETTTGTDGKMSFHTATNGTNAVKPRMTIDGAGNIGVGTSFPASLLHVSSGTLLMDGSSPIIKIDNQGGNASLQFLNAGAFLGDVAYVGNGSRVYLGMDGAQINGVDVTASGTGINTAAPATTFDVNGTAQFGGGIFKSTFSSTGDPSFRGPIIAGGAAPGDTYGNLSLVNTSGITTDFFGSFAGQASYINNGGNVGIGTTSPATKLHMSSGTFLIDGTNPALTISGGSVTASAFFGDGSHLTGVPSTGSIAGVYLPLSGGTLTGQVTTTSSITVLGAGGLAVANAGGGNTVTISAPGAATRHLLVRNTDAPSTAGDQAVIDVGFSDTRRLVAASAADTGVGATYNGFNYLNSVGAPFTLLDNSGTNALTSVSGKIGIGTTSPVTINASAALFAGSAAKTDIYTGAGGTNFQDLVTIRHPGAQLGTETLGRVGLLLKLGDESTAAESNKMAGLMLESSSAFFNNSSLNLLTGNQKRITVDSLGNVGIGTINPSQKLEVAGGAIIASGFANRSAGTGPALEIGYDGQKSVLQAFDRTLGIYVPSTIIASSITFQISGAEKMRVDTSGNVGIGTASPASKLDVNGVVDVGGFPVLTPTFFGYSSGYHVTMLGAASGTQSVAIGYDPSGNTNAGFTGDGREILFRRGAQFVTPNAANNNWNLFNLVLLDGNVGIGTASPSATLHVSSSAGISPTTNLLLVTTGTTPTNLFRVQANGNIYALGSVNGGGADLAEMYRAAPDVEAGDVVSLGAGRKIVRSQPGEGSILGVVSTRPGTVLGWDIGKTEMPDQRPVALAGRVPVKVSFENGPIKAGMTLAPSSKPGVAARAVHTGQVIGVALEDAVETGAGQGTVLCFVKSQYWVEPSEYESLRRAVDEIKRHLQLR